VEAFGADRRFLLDEEFGVTRLDEHGFTMQAHRLGRPVAVMDERWQQGPAGLGWTAELTVGADSPWLRMIGGLIERRRMPFLTRWRQHNVEEAGALAHFLPELYAERGG
jgi:hypothetical protein